MSSNAEAVLQSALELPAIDRAAIVEQLLESLDRPDPEIDALWAREAEARIDAYKSGHIAAIDEEEAHIFLESRCAVTRS